MKKIFAGIIILLFSSFAFADSDFLGIPFNITKEDNSKNSYDSKIETAFTSVFSDYCKDVDIDLQFSKTTKKLNAIHIELEYKSSLILAYFETYFVDNLKCTKVDKTYFNDNIIAYVDTSGGELHIDIATRETFNNFLNSIKK